MCRGCVCCMQTKLISNVMPIDNDSVVITATAVDYLHDSIEIFKNNWC